VRELGYSVEEGSSSLKESCLSSSRAKRDLIARGLNNRFTNSTYYRLLESKR
jgi:hypothetical protein